MAAPAIPLLTVDQYLDWCETSPAKWEYHDRRAFPLGEATIQHARIVTQFGYLLTVKMKGRPCAPAASPHVEIPLASGPEYCLSDLVVYCGNPVTTKDRIKALVNPRVIIEVLSPSTAHYDASEKFELYQAIDSLEEYVLVSQNRHKVAVFTKNESGWQLRTYTGLDATVTLYSLGVNIALAELYEGVEFENASVAR